MREGNRLYIQYREDSHAKPQFCRYTNWEEWRADRNNTQWRRLHCYKYQYCKVLNKVKPLTVSGMKILGHFFYASFKSSYENTFTEWLNFLANHPDRKTDSNTRYVSTKGVIDDSLLLIKGTTPPPRPSRAELEFLNDLWGL